MNGQVPVFVLVLVVALAIISTYYVTKSSLPHIEPGKDTVTFRDTIRITRDSIRYKYLPAKIYHDTVISGKDTAIRPVASVDTTVNGGDSLGIKYHFPPLNFFSIDYRPIPRQQVIQIQYVPKIVEVPSDATFFTKFLYFSAGAGSAFLVNKFTH